uniref:Major facilitator superfamily (MFS) profile domain-containing protein n=1 Tax=Meloidogyne incognita TaxID=6306 RepID=A0A914LRN9_MELIC
MGGGLDPQITEIFFGFVVGGYSLVQMVLTPLVGIWAEKIEQIKLPLLITNFFMLFGNIIYFFVELFPNNWIKTIFIIARLVSGIGPAQNSLLISYAASASLDKDRSTATAFITGGIAFGVTMGPTFQYLFTFLDPGLFLFNNLYLNLFTAPALFAIIMNLILHFILQFYFHESYVGVLVHKRKNKKDLNGIPNQINKKLPPYDRLAFAVCCAMRFTQYLVFTNLETIGISFSMTMFLWTTKQVVNYESIAHTARKRLNERIVCLFSLFLLIFFHLITYSWPFYKDNVVTFNSTNLTEGLGCDIINEYWCKDLKQINVWVYYISICLCMGIAFPNINVTMNTLFSRMIGPRMQSREQGILELFGGLGRMLGPTLIGLLYHNYGPRPVWILEGTEILLMALFWIFFWKRLVPLKITEEFNENKNNC